MCQPFRQPARLTVSRGRCGTAPDPRACSAPQSAERSARQLGRCTAQLRYDSLRSSATPQPSCEQTRPGVRAGGEAGIEGEAALVLGADINSGS